MTRNGNDLAGRFPQIVRALLSLAVQSCVIDGEAIVTDGAFLISSLAEVTEKERPLSHRALEGLPSQSEAR
jgi:ATP-dependent DNA ligase